jgi:hypothetical protein
LQSSKQTARLSKRAAWTHQNLSVPLKLKTIAIFKIKAHIYFMPRNIYENPVRAGFVGAAHEYWYSSANPESPLKIIY